VISFVVHGVARPQGSKRHLGKGRFKEASDHVMNWRNAVASEAAKAYKGELLTGPLLVTMTFVFPRPKSHFGTGGNADFLKNNAPLYHTSHSGPDLSKLMRAAEDAMQGVIFVNDGQIAKSSLEKPYGAKACAVFTIRELPNRHD
jgi:crossover junction endodeoxyribonuclease RusA